MNSIKYIIVKNIILSFILSMIIFAIYVELSEGMGNIWYRTNSTGNKEIFLESLWGLMMAPLVYKFYWWYEYLDLNFFIYWSLVFWILQIISVYYTVKY
jgi:hypothetical protein